MRFVILLGGLLAVHAVSAVGQTCNIQELQVASAHKASDPTLKSVHVKYNCQSPNNSVTISGFGTTAAKGEFRFLTREAGLTFVLPSANGNSPVITNLKLEPKGPLADIGSPLPSESDFSAAVTPEPWSGADFATHVFKVLTRRFGQVLIVQSEGTLKYISSYRPLTGLPNNVTGQTAIAVKYVPSESRIYVQAICQESRISSDTWKQAVTPEVLTAEQAYLSIVINDLKGNDQ